MRIIGTHEIKNGSRPPEFQRATNTQAERKIGRRKRRSPLSVHLARLQDPLAQQIWREKDAKRSKR